MDGHTKAWMDAVDVFEKTGDIIELLQMIHYAADAIDRIEHNRNRRRLNEC